MESLTLIIAYLTQYLLPTAILSFGIVANTIGFLFCMNKKTVVHTKLMHQALFLIDTLSLLILLISYLGASYDFYIVLPTQTFCKLFIFAKNVFFSSPSLILTYIIIEKFLAIKYPVESTFMRSSNTQLTAFTVILVFNAIFYSPTLYLYSMQPNKLENFLAQLNLTHCYPRNIYRYFDTNCTNLDIITPFFHDEEIIESFYDYILKNAHKGIFSIHEKGSSIDQRFVGKDNDIKMLFKRH